MYRQSTKTIVVLIWCHNYCLHLAVARESKIRVEIIRGLICGRVTWVSHISSNCGRSSFTTSVGFPQRPGCKTIGTVTSKLGGAAGVGGDRLSAKGSWASTVQYIALFSRKEVEVGRRGNRKRPAVRTGGIGTNTKDDTTRQNNRTTQCR